MNTLDPDMGELVADALRGVGVELHLGVDVRGFEKDASGNVAAVVTDDATFPRGRRRARAWASNRRRGSPTTPEWPSARPVASRPTAAWQPNVDGVWAAGDCVETFHRRERTKRVAIALGTHANKQGKVVGDNATGGYAAFPGVIGTAVTKVCELEVARTGLSRARGEGRGLRDVVGLIESTSRAGYYPDAPCCTSRCSPTPAAASSSARRSSGAKGAAKRIDVLATAIWTRHDRGRVLELDLGVRAAVLAGVGPDPRRRPQGRRGAQRSLTIRRLRQESVYLGAEMRRGRDSMQRTRRKGT